MNTDPRMHIMRQKIKEFGYSSAEQVDDTFNLAGIRLMRSPDVSKIARNGDSGLFEHSVVCAMFEYYVYMGPRKCIEVVAQSLVRNIGWCEKTWVTLHMWNMVTVWPDKYTYNTGKHIVNIDAFWLDAWSANNIEELYEKDY